jgi:RNA polymerase sigma-70 factor (ECF subfamily)
MRAYQDMVYTTAARITANDAQAQDIAQDVFLKAYDRFAELRTSPTAGGWLKTVTTRLALNHLSRYRRRWHFFSELSRAQESDEAPELEFASTDDVLAQVDAQERAALIERALQELPVHQRVPLVLYHFEGLAYEEIARALGVSLAKVKTDIFRGRAALARAIGGGEA